uniref:Uncharacterized protein n=1 Tax=Lactuca sativa TaxID=4236 RepID=A0A9R1VRL8_LACSA|nr:hypothetical protein LSAT_V11C400211770 [Lactuca sativa]
MSLRISILLVCLIMNLWVLLNDSHNRSMRSFIIICNELQYQEFTDITYNSGVQLHVYMDHFGTTLHATKENEIEDNCFIMSNM